MILEVSNGLTVGKYKDSHPLQCVPRLLDERSSIDSMVLKLSIDLLCVSG